MADQRKPVSTRVGAPKLGPIVQPDDSPYRYNKTTADIPDASPEPVAKTPVSPAQEAVPELASPPKSRTQRPKTRTRSTSTPQQNPQIQSGTLRISTRIPVTATLQRRMKHIIEMYDAEQSEAQNLTLKPVYERLREIVATGNFTTFSFVRVPKDLNRFQTTASIDATAHTALQKIIDPYGALSKSAVMESLLYQVILQMESDQTLS